MDTYPDTVQAISTALGAVAGSLTGDRTIGAYTVQMEAKWNRLTKNVRRPEQTTQTRTIHRKEKS